MKNQEIAEVFNDIADLLEIKGENPFRIRAYRRAALNIEGLVRNVAETTKDELIKISGIGQDLAGKIEEYVKTGRLQFYEDLKKEVPEGLSLLLSVPSLGPKTAKLLFERLKVKDIGTLEKLAREHKLSGLPGIKEKTEENILKGIEMLKRGIERQPLGKVLPVAKDILQHLKNKAPVKNLSIAGSIRRWKDTIKDIDVLATSQDPKAVMNAFVHLPHVKDILMHGPTKSSVIIHEGLQVDLRVVEEDSFGAALAYFTGSKAHNIRLREMAVKSGLKINEYGIFREKDEKKLGGEKEEDIYRILGLPYIPPELREDSGEIEAAIEGRLPKLVELRDIKGDLHVHSKWSDGSHDFEELIDEAKKRGYEYIAITDHSKGLGIARGLSAERLMEEKKEIDAINKRLKGFRLIVGTEVDIRSSGEIDFPDEILKKMDIVVASIHSGFRQDKEQITKRLVSAIRNPYVSIIAHPTGRLIGERDPYDVDMNEVFKVAKETGTAIEINAYPLRLDLSDIYVKIAREMGVRVVISTDTHVANQFDYMGYGVSIARRGWLEKKDVLNTLSYNLLIKALRKK
ncbi:MAG: DNA polymerase III [Nitrospirae bacterium CG_4_9_14_3_um_filter_41_27]|nr:DNA polymerase/3'-5' exonuclease PolX [Nitrospirota bacterium]OIP58798.1 MAG: DNA polymerase III [Nitrospirae bacterium CG2_30_41_42]PIQ95075.1 MAG: DNA polymerase III [Nitrospirae bacterium CG11_big_fil_rev_8_21_14_0_20_41_14]PIV41635.1 MAG: DNA polymerase III [Nitrospirae bacterium CG02_land_8_20_14_3_00_41_53]PIW86683.1 MAG: DNA polymerase III [Nitrospirae bacterium CG_4_8_14_3_um_filter_41_47]PJA78825.1 MAG: DNA polymerase III [Nitrospirae bacterium CG_4_9_14_3_um_filter_41_27]